MTNGTYGPLSGQPLARFDRESSCWKTCKDTSLWVLPMSLVTLPEWGMTRDGELCERQTPEHLTNVQGSLSSLTLFPTPTAQDGCNTAGPSQLNRNTIPLNTLVTLPPIGGFTGTPSNGGNPSRDAPRPQLSQASKENPDCLPLSWNG